MSIVLYNRQSRPLCDICWKIKIDSMNDQQHWRVGAAAGRRIAWSLGKGWRGRWSGLIGLHLPPLAPSVCFIKNNAA
jgi:hypothetical protein